MPMPPKTLLGPHHLHPRVKTESDYREKQREAMRRGRLKYPNLDWPDPWRYEGGSLPSVYLSGGMWQIHCATVGCGNRPSASPLWRLALCFECGAIYEGLVFPPNVRGIERALLARPIPANRNWLPHETVDDLQRENRAHGIEDSD